MSDALDLASVEQYMSFVQKHPVTYSKNILNIDLWQKQKDILKAIADPSVPFISVKSGNGVGKTHLAAAAVFQYLDSHAPGYAIISSSSWKQTQKGIYPLIRSMHRGAAIPLGGEMLATEWKRGDLWGAFCVSPDEPENFSGFRTRHGVMVIIDEASALKDDVYNAIQGLCSTRGSKIVLIGNPIRPEGAFYETFSKPDWMNFTISATEVMDLGIQGLANREWVDNMGREWGVNSPIYQARVLGEFPKSSSYSLIPLSWIPERLVPKVLKPKGRKRMGVDVARYGDDRTVLIIRDDRCIIHLEKHTKQSTMETVGLIKSMIDKWKIKHEDVYIDDTGLGGGVTDRLEELGYYVTPVNNAEKALERDRFRNLRTETYWRVRDRLAPDSANPLYCPKEFASVLKECAWPEYKMISDGRIALESKEDIKKRRKSSPDEADALVMTFSDDDMSIAA